MECSRGAGRRCSVTMDWQRADYIEWLAQSGEMTRISHRELKVLIVLVNKCKTKDHCWPSLARIAEESGVDDRAARRILRRLEERNLITTKRGTGRACTTIYRIERGGITPSLFPIDDVSGKKGGSQKPPFQEKRGVPETHLYSERGVAEAPLCDPKRGVSTALKGGLRDPPKFTRSLQESSSAAASSEKGGQIDPRKNPDATTATLLRMVIPVGSIARLVSDARGLDPEHIRMLCQRVQRLQLAGELTDGPVAWLRGAIRSAQAGEPYDVPAAMAADAEAAAQKAAQAACDRAYWQHRVGVALQWAASLDRSERLHLRDTARERLNGDFPTECAEADPATEPRLAYAICGLVSSGRIRSKAGRAALVEHYDAWRMTIDDFRRRRAAGEV